MEDGIGDELVAEGFNQIAVLILVLLEDGIGDGEVTANVYSEEVLILVLLEDGIGGVMNIEKMEIPVS